MILTILKVIGILLLLLVLLVAALILSILLVPIRYRLSAAFTGEKKQGEVKISWLLHLISMDASVELPISAERAEPPEGDTASEDDTDPENAKNPFSGLSEIRTKVQLRILGIDPAAVRAYFQKRKQKKIEKNREKREKRSQKGSAARVKQAGSGRQEQQNGQREAGQKKPSQRERSVSVEQTSARPEHGEQASQKIQSTDAKQPSREPLSEDAQQVTEHADTERASRMSRSEYAEHFSKNTEKTDKTGAFLHKLRGFCGKIKQIPNQVRQLISKGKKLLQKPEQMKRKVQRFLRKIEKYEAKEVLSDCWTQVKGMLLHFRVRRGRGYFRFGTGDPALTGELTGVLYLLLPTSCGELQVEPQFTENMLETELEVRGHIRLIHLVRFAWWAFFNKKLRRLIRAFRK
ncbi:MAG: DUF2953 domain-containing protein [Lachnospiraceae bacterium]|nr:DUF2953 domain-containing protein [Lachnospiraceae bacterium]